MSTTTAPATATAERRPEVPEPGRIVEVRGSTWAVTDVREQGMPRSPADESTPVMQHLVSLQSLHEDRLGEELSVVWELEVGHSVAQDRGLPETLTAAGFDDPNTLGAFIDAVRWGAVTSARDDAFQSPFRSGATVEAYQLEPLRRALAAPRTNLLLADDVGLGKTIEAGLVIQELLLRHRARSVVIVCPPSLALKWQEEVRDKFGLDFVIVTSATLADVRRSHGLAANPFRLFPRVIVSMAWLSSVRAQRLLRDVYADADHATSGRRYAFDLLVVDEAHHVAPASPSAIGGGRGYAVDSQRTIATRALAERCEHRLFLSATPHNGHSESFTALLEMIDNRRFQRGATMDPEALRQVTVRRLKTDIPEKNFARRRVETIPFEPAEDEQDHFERLTRILADSARRNGRERGGDIVALILKKRFLSSPWAFGQTLDAYRTTRAAQRLDLDDDEDFLAQYREVIGLDASDEEEGEQDQPEFELLRQVKGADPLAGVTDAELDELVTWGLGHEHRPDSRLRALVTYLDAVCRPARSWSNERVVVFTEYAATLAWIVGYLRQIGYDERRLGVIQGATRPQDREDIRARFTADPTEQPIRVLIATDSAGEGIDLQDYCHRLVNFDIPFNPSRLEQRIGRIDRYGQLYPPEVRHFAPATGTSTYAEDMRFLRRIAEKVGTVEAELGSANQLVDAEIQERFSPTARRAARKPVPTDSGAREITKILRGERELSGDLTELARTYDVRKAELHLTPGNARRVVDTALALSEQPPLIPVDDEFAEGEIFAVPDLGSRWASALDGLEDRLKDGVRRPITFDDAAVTGEDDRRRRDVVHVHLGHALMQKSSRILRNALFAADGRLHRVTAVVAPELPGTCVAVVARLVLVGRGGRRLHEEVFLTGVRLHQGGTGMAEEKVDALLDSVLDGSRLTLADAPVRTLLVEQWNAPGSRVRERLDEAMRQRSQARQRAVEGDLARRHEEDIARAGQVFERFRVNLRESLDRLAAEDASAAGQFAFFDEQRRQRSRDIARMEERLRQLDDDERREIEGLRERYADVRPYVSAAALVFAVSASDAEAWGGAR